MIYLGPFPNPLVSLCSLRRLRRNAPDNFGRKLFPNFPPADLEDCTPLGRITDQQHGFAVVVVEVTRFFVRLPSLHRIHVLDLDITVFTLI